MAEKRINKYEGFFLFPQAALADLGGAVEHLTNLLNRAEADVLALAKWDERRLAFDIDGNKRGLYLLAYFKAPASNMADFERDCNLSEHVLRSIVLRADHLTEDEMKGYDARQALDVEIVLRRERKESGEFDQTSDEEETVAAEYDGD